MLKLLFKKLRRDFPSSEKLWQSISAGEFRLVNGPSDDRVSSRWVKCEPGNALTNYHNCRSRYRSVVLPASFHSHVAKIGAPLAENPC
jgi:hypothetical protein